MSGRGWDIATNLFGLYFLGLIGWQGIETKRLLDLGDWTGDGTFTIVDIWNAWVFAWETPARVILEWVGVETLRFLALLPPPDFIVVLLSFIAWTVITFGPLIVVGYLLEELIDSLPTKKKP